MSEAEPSAKSGPVTLINIFTVQPARQMELLALLQAMTEEVTRRLPGFISAAFHRSLDGKHVANYAQWESVDHWKAMVRHPEVQARMAPIVGIATFQPLLYEQVSGHTPA